MVIDIKMSRFETKPWGFRLIGGSDFEVPLTVVKVTEGSIAESAGMKLGDIIVRINEEPTSQLTHNEAHEIILHCGNNFLFAVLREEENTENVNNVEPDNIESSELQSDILPEPEIQVPSENKHVEAEPEDTHNKENVEKVTEDEIAELISGEAEVLKEHNVVGIFPKPGVCMASDVLRQLNDEAMKTRQEKEKEKRRWTCFMQKPDRPIPKTRKQLEEEKLKEVHAYKVVIKKQLKPPAAPSRTPTPQPIEESFEPTKEPEKDPEELKPLADSDIPDLEPDESARIEMNDSSSEIENKMLVEANELITENSEEIRTEKENLSEDEVKEELDTALVPEKTEEELALEQQLHEVQKQLMALSSLPSTIQSTLDAVTKQLAEILPTFKLQPCLNDKENNDVNLESNLKEGTSDDFSEPLSEENEISEQVIIVEDLQNELALQNNDENYETNITEMTIENFPEEKLMQLEEERKLIEENKIVDDEVVDKKLKKIELWNRLFNGEEISKKTFREVNCASLAIQLNKRVNFLKYQKPEKKIDLDKSEVFKVIHHLDRQPKRGIEVRPSKVLAEEDIISKVQSG